jgi:ATP-dependent Lhr-like helicase
VLKALEEVGCICCGYFVVGLGGFQFADLGVFDRLQMLREPDPDEPRAFVLAAADPANPYGARLRGRSARTPGWPGGGLHVVLWTGRWRPSSATVRGR